MLVTHQKEGCFGDGLKSVGDYDLEDLEQVRLICLGGAAVTEAAGKTPVPSLNLNKVDASDAGAGERLASRSSRHIARLY
jgi:hypothetical protein